MAGETVVTIIGNLTADPEMRRTPSGAAVVSFTVASTPRVLDKASGEWRDQEALFMRCSQWRDPAQNAAYSYVRGQRVIVVGRLKQRSFEVEGQKRTVVEMEVDEIGASTRYGVARFEKTHRNPGDGGAQEHAFAAAGGSSDPWGNTAGHLADEEPF